MTYAGDIHNGDGEKGKLSNGYAFNISRIEYFSRLDV